jgi:hypothetical protein
MALNWGKSRKVRRENEFRWDLEDRARHTGNSSNIRVFFAGGMPSVTFLPDEVTYAPKLHNYLR